MCRYYFLWNKQSFQLYEHMFDDSSSSGGGNSSTNQAAAYLSPQKSSHGGGSSQSAPGSPNQPPAPEEAASCGSPSKAADGMKRTKTFSSSTRGLPVRLPSSTSASTLSAMADGLWTLYCQCQDVPEMPPFIGVVREVTREDDLQYSAYTLSKRADAGNTV